MATYYLDYINGNDANAGTSWALAWKTMYVGATSVRVVGGDVVRVAKSPDQTSLGQVASWTDGPLKTTLAIVGSTNATPIVVTLSAGSYTTLAPVVGDTLIVNGHTTNTKANGVWLISAVNGTTSVTLVSPDGTSSVGNGVGGATGTVRKFTNGVVKLASAVTANVAVCGNQGMKANWTASANVTDTVITTDFKEGGECQQIAVAAAFTTGLAAYFPTGTLNLAGYQQLSFWIKQTAGSLGLASSCSLKLCSDAAGVTAVNTINIPVLGALNAWSPITVDLAVALGSAIQSIALYINTDNGAQTFLLDNIIACKASSSADSLSLTSLIGKNTGTEPWLCIQSINGPRVVLDGINASIPAAGPQRGYSGATEAVTTYKRETIKVDMQPNSVSGYDAINTSGAAGNLLTFQGGFDTASSVRNGETIIDVQNGIGYGYFANSKSYVSFSTSVVRTGVGFYMNGGTGNVADVKNLNSCSVAGLQITSSSLSPVVTVANASANTTGVDVGARATITLGNCNSNINNGVSLAGVQVSGSITNASNNANCGVGCAGVSSTLAITNANNNVNYGVLISGYNSTIDIAAAAGNAYGASFSGGNNVASIASSTNNSAASVLVSGGTNYLRNSTLNSATKAAASTLGAVLFSTNENSSTDTHFTYGDSGLIGSDVATRHTASGISWKLSPTATTRDSGYPLALKVGAVACSASTAVTFSMWFNRTNTGLSARLICKGGQLSGVATTSTSMAAAAGTWEQLSVTVTPAQKGVLEFHAECWGGTTYSLFVDDVTIT